MPLEIERRFLLDRMPEIPSGAEVWRIEQGYFRSQAEHGRIRRTLFVNGSIICTHTIKAGEGIAREQTERTISIERFEQLWPMTAGRRLHKTRHRVREGGVLWEIDDIAGVEFALAEVELSSPQQMVNIPVWLRPHVMREVTDDPAYTNAAIAERMGTAD